jgi:hypothetical protein
MRFGEKLRFGITHFLLKKINFIFGKEIYIYILIFQLALNFSFGAQYP